MDPPWEFASRRRPGVDGQKGTKMKVFTPAWIAGVFTGGLICWFVVGPFVEWLFKQPTP